jgi:outer membrane protein assembly factor BamB
MQTGKVVWETRVTPTNLPYTITMAPRVIKGGRVIVGASGGEFAVRGFFAAFDANTGKELWKFYTVPGDPSKPFEQPIYAEWAKTWDASKKWWVAGGGGPVWGGVAYDPDEDLVYVGSGQPGPWTSVGRGTGDNLCTDCIIAVKGATGKYVWHYQTTPGDDWDYDSIADITLADLKINGKDRKVLMHAPKNGFVFVIDRTNGQFISAEPWVTVNWASGFDPKTGHAIVNPAAHYGTTTSVNITPGPGGGHVWVPWSYNPTTKLLYIPSTSGQRGYTFQADPNYVIKSAEIAEGARGQMQMGTGGGGGGGGGGGRGAGGGGGAGGGRGAAAGAPAAPAQPLAPGLDPNAAGLPAGAPAPAAQPGLPFIGPSYTGNNILVAWNPVTQKEAWHGPANSAAGYNQGGTLTTAGNLVFASVTGCLLAFKADTGEQVLSLATGLPQSPGPPMTFMLDGKQYIAFAGAMAGGAGAGGGGGRGGGAAAAPAAGGAPPLPGGGGAGGGGGRGGGAAAATGPQPAAARLLVLTLDGKPLTP